MLFFLVHNNMIYGIRDSASRVYSSRFLVSNVHDCLYIIAACRLAIPAILGVPGSNLPLVRTRVHDVCETDSIIDQPPRVVSSDLIYDLRRYATPMPVIAMIL
jgi:hypothetical protein